MIKNIFATRLFFLFPIRKQIKITKNAGNSIAIQASRGFILKPHPLLVKRPYGADIKDKKVKISTDIINKAIRRALNIIFSFTITYFEQSFFDF